ncbi:ABC transporter substrate-binding protein [Deltaproteobacteria bacterium PRO3]|nr:ABC transporter substrate-binding protein [Deltaproteobacteria bacterium PRO3]
MRNLIFFLILAFLFQSCKQSKPRLFESKDLVLATGIPIGDLEPYSSREGIGSNLVDLLYRPLFRLTSQGQIIPDLAREVVWNERSNTLKVVLKAPKADDVKKSIEKAKSLIGGGFYEALVNLEMIEIISPHELNFKLKKFDRAFLSIVEHLPIILFSEDIKTSGEFEIETVKDEEVSLVRKVKSVRTVNKVIVKVISSPRRAMRELVAGNVDVVILASRGDYEILKDNPEIKFGEVLTNIVYLILENRNHRPKAEYINWAHVSRLIDRKSIISSLGKESVAPADAPDPLYKNEVDENGINLEVGDLSKKRMLSLLGEQSRDVLIGRVLKRRFQEIGIELGLLPHDSKSFGREVIFNKNFDLVLLPINIKDPIVTNFLAFHTPNGPNSLNYSGYSNEKVDKLLEEARYSQDEELARESYQKAMKAIRDDPPGLFLFWLKIPIVYRQSCTGFKFSSNEFFSSLKDVRCEPSAVN